MANTMRWRYGETNPVMVPVGAPTVIEIGDLVYLDGSEAKPASEQSDQGTALGNQSLFHDAFLGVAMQASSSGDVGAIRVASTGVFEFDCSSTTFDVGDYVGASENVAGNALDNQRVSGVAGATTAIGRSAGRVSPAASRVLVDVVSSVMKGGVQPVA